MNEVYLKNKKVVTRWPQVIHHSDFSEELSDTITFLSRVFGLPDAHYFHKWMLRYLETMKKNVPDQLFEWVEIISSMISEQLQQLNTTGRFYMNSYVVYAMASERDYPALMRCEVWPQVKIYEYYPELKLENSIPQFTKINDAFFYFIICLLRPNMTHDRTTRSIVVVTEKWGALFTQFPTFNYLRAVNFLGEPTKLPRYAGPKLILLELSRQIITYHEKCLKRKKGGTPFPLTVGRYTCLSHHKVKDMFAELELLNLKHNFPARPTFDPRSYLPRAKLDLIHIPQIEDIYIYIYHEVELRRKDHSHLALAEIIQYGVAIVPKGYQTTEEEVDQVYLDTGGDDWPFAVIDRTKAPQKIKERVKETL
ncbi:hypothetical protein KI387_043782 [Taxus chinensis]|uniref:Uncharacterized protein n=1 Tax=Taxus chinensis TaxID=29808 RepID=A0AA38FNT4_TAXCH|nr:hypothetical protein KI387_043782 [Taxus chinensis]